MIITYVEIDEIIYTTKVEHADTYLRLLDSPNGFKLLGKTYYLQSHQFRIIEIEGEVHEELIVYIKSA